VTGEKGGDDEEDATDVMSELERSEEGVWSVWWSVR